MNTQTFTTVRTTRTPIEAEMLRSVLLQAGLHPVEINVSGHFSVAGTEVDYSVRVPADEETEAREVLAAHETDAR